MVQTTPKEPKHIIYAKFGDIKGPVTEPGYEGWFALQSAQWGAGLGIRNAGDPALDANGEPDETQFPQRRASDPSVSEVVVNKISGPESGKLLFNMFTKKIMDVTIVFLVKRPSEPLNADSAASASLQTLIRTTSYILNHVLLSGYSRSADPDEKAWPTSCTSETLSLNYSGMETESYDESGEPLDAIHYHLNTGTTTYKAWNADKTEFEVVITEKKAPSNDDDDD